MQRIAVVGAGISGLTAARELSRSGREVVVFERGRGEGGRVSRRREESFAFDHGAQYFTARSHDFAAQLERWLAQGVAAPWEPRMATARDGTLTPKTSRTKRYVGTPGMNALAHDLGSDLDVRKQQRVTKVSRQNGASDVVWTVHLESADGVHREDSFDAVIFACTPQQGLELLEERPHFAEQAAGVSFDPTWAVMLGFKERAPIDFDGVFFDHPALSWAARDSSKPGRALQEGTGDAWVLHASSEWSRTREEKAPREVAEELKWAFESSTGVTLGNAAVMTAHRWRYARAASPLGLGALWDGELHLGMCGDWCTTPRIQGAYESGLAVAAEITADHK